MIKAIYTYLKSDEQLVSLVGHTGRDPHIYRFVPNEKDNYPYIVFSVSPFLAGNITTQYRCEVYILTKDVRLCESIANRLLDLLHHRETGFEESGKSVYRSSHTGGGGIVYDPDLKVFQQTLIFNIIAQ